MNTPRPFTWLTGTAFWDWAESQSLPVAPITASPELVWIDMETTGLDALNEVPLELGIILTDKFGNLMPDGAVKWFIADHFDFHWARRIEEMVPFVREMHEKSGLLADLTELAKRPDGTLTARQVESQALHWLGHRFGRTFEGKDRKIPYGSSVRLDRAFLDAWMPELDKWFLHRIGDVSSWREMVKPLRPEVAASEPEKRELHRPWPDMIDSIKLYRHLVASTLVEAVEN